MKTDSTGLSTKLEVRGFTISSKKPNNYILTRNDKFFSIKKIEKIGSYIVILGKEWKKLKPIFDSPLDSSAIDMYELTSDPSDQQLTLINVRDIIRKCIIFKLNMKERVPTRIYCIPLLH